MKNKTNEQTAVTVSVVTIIVNFILTLFKIAAGLIAQSSALVADGVHTLSDCLSTFVVIIGVKMAGKKSDSDHQYGHERMECVAGIILAVVLVITGGAIGRSGLGKILDQSYQDIAVPGLLALVATLISIAVKEAMYWYTRFYAKKTDSSALMADAWHHRSDSLSSIGSFAGILMARIGYPIFDPIACIIICLFIFKAAYDIFKDSVSKMTDKACDSETLEAIKTEIWQNDKVISIDDIKTRIFADKIYIDLEIALDGGIPLREAHAVAEIIENAIEQKIPKVKHCMVHVNPK